MRRSWVLGVAVVAVGFGLASEQVAYGWDQPLRWLPDLAVGLALTASGLAALPRQRGAGVLLVLTGFAWFAGNLAPFALFWHRGFLVHLLVAYPGWRPRSRIAVAAVGIGYAAAVTPVWRADLAGLTLPVLLVAVVALGYAGSAGAARHRRRAALRAALAVAAVLVAGAAARLTVPGGAAVLPALLGYEVVLATMAIGLAVSIHRPPRPEVTDLVVDLGTARSGTLQGELARVLGDPRLQLGYWSDPAGGYVDAGGEPVPRPGPGGERSATPVTRNGEPFAILVHDRAVLDDPVLVEAVAAAAQLTRSHAQLRDQVRAQLAELTASRRRLLVAADESRRQLEQRLHDGPRQRLQHVHDRLAALPAGRGGHLGRAVEQLAGTLADLSALARGLHPRELARGLAPALASLAGRSPVPVRLSISNERFPPELEIAAWYTCAEALANTVKHAAATTVWIEVRRHDRRLAVHVRDDGRGGADPARGTGLSGLADRVEALGGSLTIESTPGTHLVADLPIPRE